MCLFVCPFVYLENHTNFVCTLPVAVAQSSQRCDTLCTSGFVTSVMLSHDKLCAASTNVMHS